MTRGRHEFPEVPWPIAVLAGPQRPANRLVGYFNNGKTGEMMCWRHAFRFNQENRGQPMLREDAIYEGFDPERRDLWCIRCARRHAWPDHEYLIQPNGTGYEVLDLSFNDGQTQGPVVHNSGSYEGCQTWIDQANDHW